MKPYIRLFESYYSSLLKNIKDPVLHYLADYLHQNFTQKTDEVIPVKALKQRAKEDSTFAQYMNKTMGQELIKKHQMGFSLQNIIDLDSSVESPLPEESIFKKYKFGKEITYDLSKWNSTVQVAFPKNTNHVFQLNLKKEIFERDFESQDEYGSNVQNVLRYISNSNHPTSRQDLTLAWVRFTIIKPGQYTEIFGDLKQTVVVLDEIQTDLDDEEFLGKELMAGWEVYTMKYFIRFVRQSLKVRKIYMPTYSTKQNMYNANPPMHLYKDLPFKVGFKKNSGADGFLLAESVE